MASSFWATYGFALVLSPGVGCSFESQELADKPSSYPFDQHVPQLAERPSTEVVTATLRRHLLATEQIADLLVLPLPALGSWLQVAALQQEGAVRQVTLLGEDVVDLSAVLELERHTHQAKFGKFSPETLAAMQEASESEVVSVDIAFTGDFAITPVGVDSTATVNEEAFEEMLANHRAVQRERLLSAKQGVLGWLAVVSSDQIVVTDYPNTPFITVTAPVEVLLADVLHDDPNVVRVDLHEEASGELLGYAGHGGMNESSLSGGACGGACVGAGTNVAIWEQDASMTVPEGIATANTRYWDDPAIYKRALTSCTVHSNCDNGDGANWGRCQAGKCRSEHMSYVAASVGMFGSYLQQGTNFSRAGTYDVDFYVANEDGQVGLDWAISQPVVYLVRSQVTGVSTNNYTLDWASRYDDVFTVQACGNTGTGVNVCQRNWNTLGVGTYRYEVWSSRTDDRRWSDSSYINASGFPSIAGLERPHILGPGIYQNATGLHMPDITSTGNAMRTTGFSGSQIGGSSFAGPAVLSVAIQAHTYEGWLSYLAKPIMRKALVMAAAVDANADGAITTLNVWSDSPDGQDGAGAPHLGFVKQVLDNNQYSYLELTDASFVSCGTNCKEVVVATVSVPLNKSLRAALVYNSCAPTQGSVPVLSNDLDLVSGAPPGYALCGTSRFSVNLNSETEMVNHRCSLSAGTVQLKVRVKNGVGLNYCGSESTEPIAVAWNIQ